MDNIVQGNEGQIIQGYDGIVNNNGTPSERALPAWANLAAGALQPLGADALSQNPSFSNTPMQGKYDPDTGQLWDVAPQGWNGIVSGITSDNGFFGGLRDFASTPGVRMLLATAMGAGATGAFGGPATGDMSFAGGGEVGSGYTASAPGSQFWNGATANSGMFSVDGADTLDSSLIGPNAGAASGSGSLFAPPTGPTPGGFDPGGELFTPPTGMDRSLLDLTATAGNANLTSPSALQQLGFNPNFPAAGGSAGDFSMDELLKKMRANPFNTAMGAFSVGSGIYGMMQSRRMQALAEQAMSKQDPFGSQRGGYQQQLAQLMADPNSVTSMPGYQFGLDQGRLAIQRRGAASGSGGNEDIALARFTPEYAQNFYGAQQQRLAQLAGAGIAPGSGGTLLAGANSSNDILSRSLASIAYGGRQLGT